MINPSFRSILCMVLLASQSVASYSQKHDRISNRLKDNVIILSQEGVVGTGFAVLQLLDSGKVFFVTAEHVISHLNQNDSVQIIFQDSIKMKARIRAKDLAMDLAILECAYPYRDYAMKQSIWLKSMKRGDPVWYIGNGIELYIPTKDYLATVNNPGKADIMQIECKTPLNGGESGAPVVGYKGIVGMLLQGGNNPVPVRKVSTVVSKTKELLKVQQNDVYGMPYATIAVFGGLNAYANEVWWKRRKDMKFGFHPYNTGVDGQFYFLKAGSIDIGIKGQYSWNALLTKSSKQEDGNNYTFRNHFNLAYGAVSVNLPIIYSLFAGYGKMIHRPEIKIDDGDWMPSWQVHSIKYPTQVNVGVFGMTFNALDLDLQQRPLTVTADLAYIYVDGTGMDQNINSILDGDHYNDSFLSYQVKIQYTFRKRKGIELSRGRRSIF